MTDLDWKHLRRRPLPEGEHPKTWPVWGIARADRREVVLESLYQYYLYAGHLLGGMHHPRQELEVAISTARKRHEWVKAAPVVLPPTLLEYSVPGKARRFVPPENDIGPVTLPRVASIALLRSDQQARDPSCCFSSLVVIWFQEEFGDAPSAVKAQIASLDWNALAFDWMP